MAIIAGISVNEDQKSEPFIQLVDGKNHSAEYFQFEQQDFHASTKKHYVEIGQNKFCSNGFQLNLPSLTGELQFSNQVKWQKTLLAPNIMGPLSYWPFMECNHGVVSMNHTVAGSLAKQGTTIDFNNGIGYIEKDWGASFPEAHIWMQSNRFQHNSTTSLSIAIAKMKLMGRNIVGFAAVLMIAQKRYLFSSYNFSTLQVDNHQNSVTLQFFGSKHTLSINAQLNNSAELVSPLKTGMSGVVLEELNGVIELKLTHKRSNKEVYQDVGINAGIEVAGEWQTPSTTVKQPSDFP